MLTLTCCQDHILTENIWFVWSETSYSGDGRRCHGCGTNNEQPNSEDRATQPSNGSWRLSFAKLQNSAAAFSFQRRWCMTDDSFHKLFKRRKWWGVSKIKGMHVTIHLFNVDIYMCECLIHVGTVQLYSIEITFETGPSLRVDRQSPSKTSWKSNFQPNRPTCPSSRLSLVSSPLSSLSLL